MGDTLDFPSFPGQPELDGMDRAQLLSCLERIQLVREQLDELEPEGMDSDAYEDWGERHGTPPGGRGGWARRAPARRGRGEIGRRPAPGGGAPPFHSLSAQQATASRKNREQPGTALS